MIRHPKLPTIIEIIMTEALSILSEEEDVHIHDILLANALGFGLMILATCDSIIQALRQEP